MNEFKKMIPGQTLQQFLPPQTLANPMMTMFPPYRQMQFGNNFAGPKQYNPNFNQFPRGGRN